MMDEKSNLSKINRPIEMQKFDNANKLANSIEAFVNPISRICALIFLVWIFYCFVQITNHVLTNDVADKNYFFLALLLIVLLLFTVLVLVCVGILKSFSFQLKNENTKISSGINLTA